MTNEEMQRIKNATDGLPAYEYIANNIDTIDTDTLGVVTDLLMQTDLNGQFA